MDFKKNLAYQIGTLFGLGLLPGGGTWASLVFLLPAIFIEDPLNFLTFFVFITLFLILSANAVRIWYNSTIRKERIPLTTKHLNICRLR